jgi:hypothetical protein
MQFRCLYCLKEQWMPAVAEISAGEAGCAWCHRSSTVMTVKQYQDALNAAFDRGPIPNAQVAL